MRGAYAWQRGHERPIWTRVSCGAQFPVELAAALMGASILAAVDRPVSAREFRGVDWNEILCFRQASF